MKKPKVIVVGQPTISFSRASYLKVEEKLRQQAKAEKAILVTERGIEDYTKENNE